MKKYLIIFGVVIVTATTYLIVSKCIDTKHKYTICYEHGKYAYYDYTDTFQVINGAITYINGNGVEVTRYGTFSIEKNREYKK